MKKIFKKVNILFLGNIIIFSLFCFSVSLPKKDIKVIPYTVNSSTFYNVLELFYNNIIATLPYLIPVLGFGKFLLDMYITAVSVKMFIIEEPLIDFLTLFTPHFLFELYGMTLIIYISISLFKNVIFGKKIRIKKIILLYGFSVFLLFIASLIEVLERNFIK